MLPDEAVDRLRSAAGTIISDSPEFKRLLKEVGGTIVAPGTTHAAATDQGALARECRRP